VRKMGRASSVISGGGCGLIGSRAEGVSGMVCLNLIVWGRADEFLSCGGIGWRVCGVDLTQLEQDCKESFRVSGEFRRWGGVGLYRGGSGLWAGRPVGLALGAGIDRRCAWGGVRGRASVAGVGG